jgi:hypothetical protein
LPGWLEDEAEVKFFQPEGGRFNVWWTPSPVRAPVLTAWAGGTAAERMEAEGADPVQAALDDLAGLLGASRGEVEAQLEDWHRHDYAGLDVEREREVEEVIERISEPGGRDDDD